MPRSIRYRWWSSRATSPRTTTASIRTRKSTCTRMRRSTRSTARSSSARGAWISRTCSRRSSRRPSRSPKAGGPGPVLVDVPMDIFSKEIDVALFERLRHNAKTLQKPSLDEETAADDRAEAGRGEAPGALCRRRHHAGRCGGRVARLRRPPADPRRAHADGQGRAARRSPVRARHDRLLGHQVHQRAVPWRRL